MIKIKNYLFDLILLVELVTYPFSLLIHWIKVLTYKSTASKERMPIYNRQVKVCVHEWGGYSFSRVKKIKHGVAFSCGLGKQIKRFSDVNKFDLAITMSDKFLWKGENQIQGVNIIEVDNKGMDFSGYEAFYRSIENQENCYVILTNSSVNNINYEFISGYLDYMNSNLDVGALGISYCTKMFQTLIRPNFYPHIQSFFIMTTLQVLRDVVSLNNGEFPGKGIDNKLLLIRKGEIRFSQLVTKAGYHLAVVNPLSGVPFKFTDYCHWVWPKGDIRQLLTQPNCIIPIKKATKK